MCFLIYLVVVVLIGLLAASIFAAPILGPNKWKQNHITLIVFVTMFLTVTKASPVEILLVYLVIFLAWSILVKIRHLESTFPKKETPKV
jgi:chromate transport protein ChrA